MSETKPASDNMSEHNNDAERHETDEHRSHHIISHWIACLLRQIFY